MNMDYKMELSDAEVLRYEKEADRIAKKYNFSESTELRVLFLYRVMTLKPKPAQKEIERQIGSISNHARELRDRLKLMMPVIKYRLSHEMTREVGALLYADENTEFWQTFWNLLDELGSQPRVPTIDRKWKQRKREIFYRLVFREYGKYTGDLHPKGSDFISFCHQCSQAVGENLAYDSVERYVKGMKF